MITGKISYGYYVNPGSECVWGGQFSPGYSVHPYKSALCAIGALMNSFSIYGGSYMITSRANLVK